MALLPGPVIATTMRAVGLNRAVCQELRQAQALFARAGSPAIGRYSELTHEPARPHDTLFVIVGC